MRENNAFQLFFFCKIHRNKQVVAHSRVLSKSRAGGKKSSRQRQGFLDLLTTVKTQDGVNRTVPRALGGRMLGRDSEKPRTARPCSRRGHVLPLLPITRHASAPPPRQRKKKSWPVVLPSARHVTSTADGIEPGPPSQPASRSPGLGDSVHPGTAAARFFKIFKRDAQLNPVNFTTATERSGSFVCLQLDATYPILFFQPLLVCWIGKSTNHPPTRAPFLPARTRP